MSLRSSPQLQLALVEAFATGNLAFLAVDIWFAHSTNNFGHPAEWAPLAFSIVAPLVLLPGLLDGTPLKGRGKAIGFVVGFASLAMGVAGLVLHLHSAFFVENTLKNLVYTAPFAAPLAYTGLGLLLILNRMEKPGSDAYGQWILLLAAGGFAGNFLLALADHAQNGFFHRAEWAAVFAASVGFGFVFTAAWFIRDRWFLKACVWVLFLQAFTGVIGAGYHLRVIVAESAGSLLDSAIHTAPIFAPLLFADLAILGGIGLCCVWPEAETETQGKLRPLGVRD